MSMHQEPDTELPVLVPAVERVLVLEAAGMQEGQHMLAEVIRVPPSLLRN